MDRETKDRRNTYVKKWRQTVRRQRRASNFVEEYVREKYGNIYDEAMSLYKTLDAAYPRKNDLRKTNEFRKWKKGLKNHNTSETPSNKPTQNQTATTPVNHEPAQEQPDENIICRTSPQPPSPQAAPTETPAEIATPQVLTPSEIGAEVVVEIPSLIDPENMEQRIEEILQELRNDPDLEGIFNNLPFNVDEGFEDDFY